MAEHIVKSLAIVAPKSRNDAVVPRSAATAACAPWPSTSTSVSAVPLKVALPPALPSFGQLDDARSQPPWRKWAKGLSSGGGDGGGDGGADGGGGGDGEADGGGGDSGGGDDGRTFPEHPSPILHAARDTRYSKGKSLSPTYIYIERERERGV